MALPGHPRHGIRGAAFRQCARFGYRAMVFWLMALAPAATAEPVSGQAFQSAEIQALQEDDFANPGLLWRDRGEALFASGSDVARACADCHSAGDDAAASQNAEGLDAAASQNAEGLDAEDEDLGFVLGMGLVGAATRYPRFDVGLNRMVNLEGRINACRTLHQERQPHPYESDELLAITTYVASLSRGMPMRVAIDGPARDAFETGRRIYHARQGQMNLACVHCHEHNVGRKLRGDTLSQGQMVGYPAYRLEWQALGSLHRRLRACFVGVRAEPPTLGTAEYTALELYLAHRARGLPVETPGVRR